MRRWQLSFRTPGAFTGAIALVATVGLSCGSAIKVKRTQGLPTVDRPPDCEIQVFYPGDEVEREYEVACEIDAKTGTTLFHDKSAAAAIEQARPAACQCGADALMVRMADSTGPSALTWGRGSALLRAIRFKRTDAEFKQWLKKVEEEQAGYPEREAERKRQKKESKKGRW